MPYYRSRGRDGEEGGERRRATLEAAESISMPPVTRSRAKSSGRRRKTGSSKVRVVKGRVRLRVAGYQGLQSLSPSQLVKFIAASKLRLAAKQVLKRTKRAAKKTGRRRRRGGRKGRKKARKGRKRRRKTAAYRQKRRRKRRSAGKRKYKRQTLRRRRRRAL